MSWPAAVELAHCSGAKPNARGPERGRWVKRECGGVSTGSGSRAGGGGSRAGGSGSRAGSGSGAGPSGPCWRRCLEARATGASARVAGVGPPPWRGSCRGC
eukprot:2700212-Prymnesium_polylepis.1